MANSLPQHSEVIIIGAGPAGAAMASMLADAGIYPLVIEREQFPRFTIGESLLPEALNCLDTAGLLDVVESADFQYKDGALFATNQQQFSLNFADGFTSGRHHAYQVPRADFDLRLINRCIEKGVQVSYQTSVVDIAPLTNGHHLILELGGERHEMSSNFLVDASGSGRVLAKKFKLDKPSGLTNKNALFCHIDANFSACQFDRNKILIAQVHVDDPTWYWFIPFTGTHCSVGVVCDEDVLLPQHQREQAYRKHLEAQNLVATLVGDGKLLREVGCARAYSSSITSLYGHRYVILGNAGEFIDPIFSSGVTIALKSAELAAPLVLEAIKGTIPNWEEQFQRPLMAGVDTFKQYVLAWYAGILPNLFHQAEKNTEVASMICSILSGYVWDRSNPFTKMTVARLKNLLIAS